MFAFFKYILVSLAVLFLGIIDLIAGLLLYTASFSGVMGSIAKIVSVALLIKGAWSVFAYFAYR